MTPTQLKHWRASLNLTQREAAKLLHVTLAAYQHWERGIRTPPRMVETLCAIIARPGNARLLYGHLRRSTL